MSRVEYDPTISMREARAQYFLANAFGEDGGYTAAWVDFKLGPIPMPIPNLPSRVRAVKVHDLHHIVTGYQTDTLGEFEISAWELGAGCKDFYAAWYLNLSGMTAGIVIPSRVFRAFVRGRRSTSLYGQSIDALLEQTVRDTRAQTRVPETAPAASVSDYALFVATLCLGVTATIPFVLASPLLVAMGVFNHLKRKSERATQAS
ncbi:MAG: hypothetical protein Q8Q09_23270 [Deltaproteobacteria bacterium]|nr:hypothetical protein [Deltaproteobacteria bacterium]